jgi:Tol biopolymer transport system component
MIVLTEVAGDLGDSDYITGNFWRYTPESRIVVLNPNNAEDNLKVLTEDFFSARSPEISFDGQSMIFTAQKKQNDTWQIWEMNLENLKVRQVTSSSENCIDPAYLPGERVVFSKFSTNDIVKNGHTLFTCNLDGSETKQITFNPHGYFAPTVLQDGRVLTISRQLYPDQKEGMLMVLRPDGSKQELFYKGLKESVLHSRPYEMSNGKVVFIESNKNKQDDGNIIAVNYNRPLHSRIDLSSGIKGDFYNVSPLSKDKLLVSYRSSDDNNYALYEFDTENNTLGQSIYETNKYHVLEAVVVRKNERPKKLPSELNMDQTTGLLLCQNINFSNMEPEENNSIDSKAVSIEVMGIDSLLGTVDVEKDGSFYLKVLADTPFQIRTIDENGRVVNGPGSWMYMRPNERRGCVGCHEDNEQVPENRQALAVKKEPILIPEPTNEIHNKKEL